MNLSIVVNSPADTESHSQTSRHCGVFFILLFHPSVFNSGFASAQLYSPSTYYLRRYANTEPQSRGKSRESEGARKSE